MATQPIKRRAVPQQPETDPFDALPGEERERSSGLFWSPEPGDIIQGVYAKKRTGKYHPVAEIALISPTTEEMGLEEDQFLFVGLNAILEDLLPGVLVGHRVAIRYEGTIKTGKGNDLKTYRVKDQGEGMPF